MVEIFKTNVLKKAESTFLVTLLSERYPSHKINFDLFDRDKILRVEGEPLETTPIMLLVKEYGFTCEVVD